MKLKPGAASEEENKAGMSAIKSRMAELKQIRDGDVLTEWEELAPWVLPRRDFWLPKTRGGLRRKKLVDLSGAINCERAAALIHGYMINPWEPWIRPKLLTPRELSREEEIWFEDTGDRIFNFLSGSRSSYRTASHEALLDWIAFGNSVKWSGSAGAAQRPYFKSVPLKECYWAEGEDGTVDTLYRRFTMTLVNAVKRAQALGVFEVLPGLKRKWNEGKGNHQEELTMVRAVEPRVDGVYGAAGHKKPFSSVLYCEDTDDVLQVSGYDLFPFTVSRLTKRAGSAYGQGLAWNALPAIKLLNALKEGLLRQAEQEADPALIDVNGVFRDKALDRRPGAVNFLQGADFGLAQPRELLQRVQQQGNLQINVEVVRELRREIEQAFFTDWMALGEGKYVTAEHTASIRDLRLRAMSPMVARGEQEDLTHTGDRSFYLLQKSGGFTEAPQSLADEVVDYDYTSPLAQAQKRGELEEVDRVIQGAMALRDLDPDSLDVFDFDEIARSRTKATGAPVRYTRSLDEVERLRAERQKRRQQQEQAEQAEKQARALRDGSQALNTAGLTPEAV